MSDWLPIDVTHTAGALAAQGDPLRALADAEIPAIILRGGCSWINPNRTRLKNKNSTPMTMLVTGWVAKGMMTGAKTSPIRMNTLTMPTP